MIPVSVDSVIASMDSNIWNAARQQSDAEARIARAEVGDPALDGARFLVAKARGEQRHWREHRSFWRWIRDNHPQTAAWPAQQAAERFAREVPPPEMRPIDPPDADATEAPLLFVDPTAERYA